MKQHLSMEECKCIITATSAPYCPLNFTSTTLQTSNKYLPLQDNNGIYLPTTRNEINRFDRLHQTMKSIHSKHALKKNH